MFIIKKIIFDHPKYFICKKTYFTNIFERELDFRLVNGMLYMYIYDISENPIQ